MTLGQLPLLIALASPFATAIATFALGEERHRARFAVNIAGALLAVVGAAATLVLVRFGAGDAVLGVPLLGIGFGVKADALGALFAAIASGLWLVSVVYATGYMDHAKDRARFFGFFAICVGSAVGVALSQNLLSLFVFYELLTLATYPLVVHTGTAKALSGGRTYLTYALPGGAALAVGIVWLYAIAGPVGFAAGGSLPASLVASQAPALIAIFALLMIGFGVKAALFPLHGWLPAAMVAPAPVSGLLHAVAVVKAGVFGISRTVLEVYGPDAVHELNLALPLAVLAAFTIIFGSVKALAADDFKRRLAFSTVSQLSYITIGVAIGTPLAAAAAVAHLAHHAVMKITMFFTAGALAEELKVYKVSEMDGVGKRMPMVCGAFTLAALGIVGVPPIAGFVTKWGIGLGALDAHWPWILGVLGVSSVLNAAYFFPIIGRMWFGTPHAEWVAAKRPRPEGDMRLVMPLVITSMAGLAFGLVAGMVGSPSAWASGWVLGAADSLLMPWNLAGMFPLDATSWWFLALAVLAWGAAAVASLSISGRRQRFSVFFAQAALGGVALALIRDPAAFYTAFSVMALATYGLVAHDGTPEARRAARVYLSFTVVGEALLLAGLMIGSAALSAWVGAGAAAGTTTFAVALAASPWRDAALIVLLLAFGIKVGALGVHGWMPLTYRALPGPAVIAVAGGASAAGVLGMVRFLPGGVESLPVWGALVMTFGIAAAFFGAVVGMMQRDAKTLLAYSSISQYGLITVGVGAGLAMAELWPAAVAAAIAYAVHHGIAKAALFAAEDVSASGARLQPWLAVIPAAALTGLPLTSGAVAKVALKGVTGELPGAWHDALELLLPLAAVGTTLLMARYLALTLAAGATPTARPGTRGIALTVLVVASGGAMWVLPELIGDSFVAHSGEKSLTLSYLVTLVWPVALGGALAAGVWAIARRAEGVSRLAGAVPPGDLFAPLFAAAASMLERAAARRDRDETVAVGGDSTADLERDGARVVGARLIAAAGRVESGLLTWAVAMTLIAIVTVWMLLLAR